MKKTILSVFVMALALASTALLAATVDQDAPTNNMTMARFSQLDLAQSFQQASTIVSGAGIFLSDEFGSTDLVTISLYDKLPTDGGSRLAQGSAAGTAGSWFDVQWNPVSVTPNMTYFLVFGGNSTLAIAGDSNHTYKRGHVYANSGFQSYPDLDYAFRTYTSDANVAVVPEPQTYALLIAGLVAVGSFARRRKTGERSHAR